jgi:oligogalacturonide lyase
MKAIRFHSAILIKAALFAAIGIAFPAPAQIVMKWTDTVSGHEIRRLTDLPGTKCGTLYFHQEVFTADGKSMIFVGEKDGQRRIYLMDWPFGKTHQLTQGSTDNEVLAPKSKRIFFTRGRKVMAMQLDNGKEKVIATLPDDWDRPVRLSINSDETILASAEAQGLGALKKKLGGGRLFDEVFAAHLTNRLFTVEIATGKVRVIHETDTWLGHVQFSPTDPQLLMFCQEGPWAELDRIWLVRADGSDLRLAYKRQVPKEIAGHEFWSADGKSIWFDNPFPARTNTALSTVDVATLAVKRFPLPPELASVHFNRSPDGNFITAEGNAQNKRLSLLWLKDGRLEPELLTTLEKHDYKIEPDTHVSPDGKWIVFHSDQQGDSQVYAIAVNKSNQ